MNQSRMIFYILFGIIVLVFGFSQNASAVEVSNVPQEYVVEILLTSIGEINKNVGSYELDFWYSIYSEGADHLIDPPPQVDYINGKDVGHTSQYLGSDLFEERVQGVFVAPMDFRDFPFEKINLRVELEPGTSLNTDYVTLSVDPGSGIDNTANIPGWFLSEPTFHVTENTYNNGDTYSRYVAEFTVERSPLGSFLKTLFPVLIVVGISFIGYIVPEHHDIVAEYSLLPLVAVVFLHVDALAELPPLGYLTLFDKVILISYALIANNVVALGREINRSVHHGVVSSQKVQMFHLKISPLIIAVLAAVLFFL